MARKIIEHKDFTGGDWGRRQPWNAPKNSFKALNMLVYKTGELGVRPGLQNVTPSNVIAGQMAWGMAPVAGLSQYYYGQGTKMIIASALRNRTQTTQTGNFGSSVSGGSLYYAVQGQSVLYINAPAIGIYSLIGGTLTQLVAALAGNGLAFFGDRLVIGEYSGTTSQLRYNGLTAGVSDLTSWPAANIIPVGDKNERINNLWVQRGHLDILKFSNGFFVLTGQLGVNEVLRRAVRTLGPNEVSLGGSTLTENDTVWFTAGQYHNIPAMFDGTSVRYFEDQLIPYQSNGLFNMTSLAVSDPSGVAITVGSDTATSSVYNKTKLMLFYHGMWTQHELPDIGLNSQLVSTSNLTVFDPGEFTSATAFPSDTSSQIHQVPALVIANGSAATPVMYSLLLDTDRPGYQWSDSTPFFNFNAERPGDDSAAQVSGSVDFPEVHLSDANEFMVQGVIVDFRSWNTNGSLTNHFDLNVKCLRRYNDSSPFTSLAGRWDEPGSLSSTAGTLKREVFMFGDQGLGNGYQLSFTNIRGIAIQRIQVIVDSEQLRGI